MMPLSLAVALAFALSVPAVSLAQAPSELSQLTAVEVTGVQPSGTYGGVDYVTVSGVVRGQAGPEDARLVRGLQQALAAGGAKPVPYESKFQLIVPAAGQPANEVIYVDSENRGGAVSQGALGGFLQTHRTSYARVQWQTGYSAGVPAGMQGLGLLIMRDFARWLGGDTAGVSVTGDFRPQAYDRMILGGISQSAWFVNTFIAEGFNADPAGGGRVFDAAIAIDGVGGWLAINDLAARRGVERPFAYVVPNGAPLSRAELLRRPASDPLYIDVANYTDFYRLRAGLTAIDESDARFRRYDWPAPHANGVAARCGWTGPVNPIRFHPYFRALVWNVEKAIGVKSAAAAPGLPQSAVFQLGPTPSVGSPYFNGLPGAVVRVPLVDHDGWPAGGVRFPEAVVPTAQPDPVSVPPSDTSSIDNTCGNAGGWKAWDAERLTARYGGKAGYLAAYSKALDAMIEGGFVLPEDREAMLKGAEAYWPAA